MLGAVVQDSSQIISPKPAFECPLTPPSKIEEQKTHIIIIIITFFYFYLVDLQRRRIKMFPSLYLALAGWKWATRPPVTRSTDL